MTIQALTAFPGLSGQGVKIAVIDSGVNAQHPHISANTEGIAIEGIADDAIDQLGHGTAVMAAIQDKAPEAQYFAVKLFGSSLRTNMPRLLKALDWAVAKGVDIINLSLGTPNFDYRDDLADLVARAEAAGTLLVCARSEMDNPVLPGRLHGVLPVEVDWQLPRELYYFMEEQGRRHFVASGFPRSLPGVPQTRNLHGISFAVANMTGFVARACQQTKSRSVAEISDILVGEATRLKSTLETQRNA
jgi:hypothetical protein